MVPPIVPLPQALLAVLPPGETCGDEGEIVDIYIHGKSPFPIIRTLLLNTNDIERYPTVEALLFGVARGGREKTIGAADFTVEVFNHLNCADQLVNKGGMNWSLKDEAAVFFFMRMGLLIGQLYLAAAPRIVAEAPTGDEAAEQRAKGYALQAKAIFSALLLQKMDRREELQLQGMDPPWFMRYVGLLRKLAQEAQKAPRYDDQKRVMPGEKMAKDGNYILPIPGISPRDIIYRSNLTNSYTDAKAFLRQQDLEGEEELLAKREKMKTLDGGHPAESPFIYDPCFYPGQGRTPTEKCVIENKYTDRALDIDFKLATIYKNMGNPQKALKYLWFMVQGQDPREPALNPEMRGQIPATSMVPQTEQRKRNFYGAIPLLFGLLVNTRDERNIEDAVKLYRYFLDGGVVPTFRGTYASQVQQIVAKLADRKDDFWPPDEKGLVTRSQFDKTKLRAEMEGAYPAAANEELKDAQSILGDKEEGITAKGGDPGPALEKARRLLSQFDPARAVTAEANKHAQGNYSLLVTLYIRWAEREVLAGRGLADPTGKLRLAREALETFYQMGGIDYVDTGSKSPKKRKGGVGTWLYIAYVYTKWAQNVVKASPRKEVVQTALDKAEEALGQFDAKLTEKPGVALDEEKTEAVKSLGFIAVVYAQWAQKIRKRNAGEALALAQKAVNFAEQCEAKGEGKGSGILLEVLICILPIYIYLGKFDQKYFAKAEAILGKIFREGIKGGKNPALALKAVSSLNWLYVEELKALKESRSATLAQKRELVLKSMLLWYALSYGEKGGGPIKWTDFNPAEIAQLENDELFKSYFSHLKTHQAAILRSGSGRDKDGETIFTRAGLEEGEYAVTAKLADALADFSRVSSSQDAKRYRKAAISLHQQIIHAMGGKGGKLAISSIWALAGLTGERKWLDDLEQKIKGMTSRKEREEKREEKEKRLSMCVTLASGFFALGVEAQKQGKAEESKELFGKAVSIYQDVVTEGGAGDKPVFSTHELLDIWLKYVEVLKVQKDFAKALEELGKIEQLANEGIGKAGKPDKLEEAKNITAQLKLTKLLTRLAGVEVKVAQIKHQLYKKELDLFQATEALSSVEVELLGVLVEVKEEAGSFSGEEIAELIAAALVSAMFVYGSLGGVKAQTLEGGEKEFKDAAWLFAVLLGKEGGLPTASKEIKEIVALALREAGLLEALENKGQGEYQMYLTVAQLLSAAAKANPELLAKAEEFFKLAMEGMEGGEISSLLPKEQNFYLEAKLGLISARIMQAQHQLSEDKTEEAQNKIDRAVAEVERLQALVEKELADTVYLSVRLKVYTTMAWAYGVKGGVEEKAKEGKGRGFFEKARGVYENYFIKEKEAIELYPAAEKPYLGGLFLEEAEIQPLNLAFDYLEVVRATLKRGKDNLDLTIFGTPGAPLEKREEDTINKMLGLYRELEKRFTDLGNKVTVRAALLEFKMGLAQYYKQKGRMDLWDKYIGEILGEFNADFVPRTEKEDLASLKLKLIYADALAAKADQLYEVFEEETEEIETAREKAAAVYRGVLKRGEKGKAAEKAAYEQRLRNTGRSLYDLQIEYLRIRVKLKDFESDPLFNEILGRLEKLDKFFIRAYTLLGDAYLWDKKIRDVEKARGFYAKAKEKAEKADTKGQGDSWYQEVLDSIYKGEAWVALELSKGEGTFFQYNEAYYAEAEEKFTMLLSLFKDRQSQGAEEVLKQTFAYFGLGELALRGKRSPNYEQAKGYYEQAREALKANQDGGAYPDIASAKMARNIYMGLAEVCEKLGDLEGARNYAEQARNVMSTLKVRIPATQENDRARTYLAGLPKRELERRPEVSMGPRWGSSDFQGQKETSAGGVVAGKAEKALGPDDKIGIAVKVRGGKLDRSVTAAPVTADSKELQELDAYIEEVKGKIAAAAPGKGKIALERELKRLERQKGGLLAQQQKGRTLLQTDGEVQTALDFWWKHRFGRAGELQLHLTEESNHVFYHLAADADPYEFNSVRVGPQARFTFTGFNPVLWDIFLQPYVEGGLYLSAADKQNGLVEMQRRSVDSVRNFQDPAGQATLSGRSEKLSGIPVELDYEGRVGVQAGRSAIRLWDGASLDLLGNVGYGYVRNAYRMTSGLFWPREATDPLYYADPTQTGREALDLAFHNVQFGLAPTLYLCDGKVIIPLQASADMLFKNREFRGWNVFAEGEVMLNFWEGFRPSIIYSLNAGEQYNAFPWRDPANTRYMIHEAYLRARF